MGRDLIGNLPTWLRHPAREIQDKTYRANALSSLAQELQKAFLGLRRF